MDMYICTHTDVLCKYGRTVQIYRYISSNKAIVVVPSSTSGHLW